LSSSRILSVASPLVALALACLTACATAPRTDRSATMTLPRVAVPLIDHKLAPDQILQKSQAAEAECEKALKAIIELADPARTFANTVEAMEQAVDDYGDAAQRLGLLKDVHPDEKVREAAAVAEENAGKFLVKIASRRDLYKAVKGWLAAAGAHEVLDFQQKRLLELTLRDFRRNGLELADDKLARLVVLRTRLTELATQFQQHLNENSDSIEATDKELEGLPASYVERLAKGKASRVVTTKYPDFYPFMENGKSGEARKRLYVAFESREAARNTPLLKEAIALRDEEAKLLGYATHADYMTEDQMSKSSKAVATFLGALKEQLKPRRDADFNKMQDLKRAETGDAKASLEPWDVAYYLNQIKKRDFALDNEKIREFFPSQTVLGGMFKVYETLLGLEIKEIAGADVWSPEVKFYEIHDRATGVYLGAFYSDLYPRKGKYGHAASAPVTVARQVGAEYRAPIAVLLANFNPPGADRPSLLAHDEVKTLFHEFGHIMHQTLTVARYGSQSGSSVARDFVEAPSQMLENWVYEKPVLDLMSGHWQDPTQKLSEETVAKIKQARTFDAGWRYTRQVFLASFDQAVHTAGAQVDADAVSEKLYAEILGLTPAPGTHFPATFGHLMGGYDAGYYGYLWAEVFADDMFSKFAEKGVMDPVLGRAYRDIILARGRSEEPDQLLRDFLGREPNNAAFLRKLGIH
jgi:thimet oligopeptidase